MCDKTLTTNGGVSLMTTENCFVDFFMMFVRGIDTDVINKYLTECWNIDPVKTVALIFHARDRKNGKKEKNISNRAMIWLKHNKCNTYRKNLYTYITKYGSWKDIMYISTKHSRNDFEINTIATQLLNDKDCIQRGDHKNVSLCAKWASSEGDKYDINFHIAHKIALSLYPDDEDIMKKYRKEILVPLRKKIDIVETYMSSNRWNEIKYENVPAVATKRLKKVFQKHDPEGYAQYLNDVAKGAKKINITGILPHELVKFYIEGNEYNETIEQQWKAILKNIKDEGILSNMLAIVDVSGSMINNSSVKPIEPAIALGILISECNEGLFHNKIISFDSKPEIFDIKGDNLFEKVKNIRYNLSAGTSTNFEGTFDLLLNMGKMFDVKPEQMPKKVIVLSDMQFDEASDTDTNEYTIHECIINKYKDTIYKPPQFIYWNLSSSHDETFPVKAVSSNVAMISGFSEQLLKVFMNNNDFNANSIVDEILSAYTPDVIIDYGDN